MCNALYLRRQAETCFRLARTTFDLSTAEQLRYLAVSLQAKAAELDDETVMKLHMMREPSQNESAGENNRN